MNWIREVEWMSAKMNSSRRHRAWNKAHEWEAMTRGKSNLLGKLNFSVLCVSVRVFLFVSKMKSEKCPQIKHNQTKYHTYVDERIICTSFPDYITLCKANPQWDDDPFKFISAKHAINLLIFISFTSVKNVKRKNQQK